MKYYISQKEKNEIIKLYNEGLTVFEIAKKLLIPYTIIEEVIKKDRDGNWVYEA